MFFNYHNANIIHFDNMANNYHNYFEAILLINEKSGLQLNVAHFKTY